MAKIKITCRHCGQVLVTDEQTRARKIKCPHCKHSVRIAPAPLASAIHPNRRGAKRKFLRPALVLILGLFLVAVLMELWVMRPAKFHWADHRPIGALFLASDGHTSTTNPRGWFNDEKLDITGPGGAERFRQALMDYTDRSIAILKRTGAQGVIVWDLEGEQFPHKTTFIGDPRTLDRLAPEMAAAVDEFFARLRDAGFQVGLTIRPQQLVFGENGVPRQTGVLNLQQSLLEKIDYARKRWGATLFYVDSNGGIRRPDEAWQLRRVAEQRPDVLLIPEHHYLPYWAFSAPYSGLRKGDADVTANWARKWYRNAFQVLDISDGASHWEAISAARLNGDILLFRAWHESPEVLLLEKFANEQK